MTWSAIQRTSICLFILALFACTATFAQTGTTSLRGVVTDKTGAAIVGATVTISSLETGSQRETKTGSNGEYEFLALPPGKYTLAVERENFQKYEQVNLNLLVNLPATQNVTLKVGSTTETVEVSAAAVTLNTTDASLGNAFSTRQVMELPLEAGNVPELLSLQAGVAYTGDRTDINKDIDTRNGAVNGARSDQSNITLDGVDVNADITGYAFTSVLPITQDSVQEFRVTTSNYNADEGRSSGAQVSLVTKSGTNDFHGAAFWSTRNTYTSANDYFVKLAEENAGQPNTPPKLIRNNFGGAVGGPVWRDRLFFFVNYEGHRERDAVSTVRIVPSASLQDGVIQYVCADPSQCPGGTVQGLTTTHNVAPGNYALGPSQIQAMDPQGIGVSSSVMIPYFKTFAPYQANDNSVGDGLNFVGYRFKGPESIDTNWYIARVDYKLTRDGNHSLFWRGALRNDPGDFYPPYLPNQTPLQTFVDFSKGFAVGYSAVLRPNLVNDLRYGFTRQSYGLGGNQTQDEVFFRGLNDNSTSNLSSLAYTPTTNYQVPVHNITDDVSWMKGKHTWQFGLNFSFLRDTTSTNTNSFSFASDNPSWLDTASMANTGVPGHFDPGCSQTAIPVTATATNPGCFDGSTPSPNEPHYPLVDSGFGNNYDYPLGALIGMVTEDGAQYNFTRSGGTLGDGVAVKRHFADDGWEMYAQDQWKVRKNLTLTLGLRYSLFAPPWETNGLQVAPTQSLTTYYDDRVQAMLNGLPASSVCCMTFNLAGPANGKPGFYNWDKKDFGPRVAFAWSPQADSGLFNSLFGNKTQTTIRGGFSMVYDRLGPALLQTFDQNGSFGLSTTLNNTGGVETPAIAPRATGISGPGSIPQMDLAGNQMYAPSPGGTFPQTFPSGLQGDTGSYAVYWGMDNQLKTPYAYTIDFSVARELGHDVSIQVAYVGRLAHRLLSQEDVASPLDLVDPKTHIDYYTAVQALAKLYRSGVSVNSITPSSVGPTAQYWQDMLQSSTNGYAAPNFCGDPVVNTALQAAYNLFSCFSYNETTALQYLDQGFGLKDPITGNPIYAVGGPYSFVDPQFASLFAWRSIGTSSYNALQVNVQKHMSHGVQFDFNYTYSKSLDISSDANRINDEGGLGGQVILPWDPKALRGVSDFDLTHQFNGNWIVELPFGRGKRFAGEAHGILEGLIGGWQLSGLIRWTSGFPIGVTNGAEWPTNWELSGFATQIAPVTTRGAVKNPDGSVNIFGTPAQAAAAFSAYTPDMPGQVGARNTLRGDGFAGLDAGLTKRWKMPWKESHTLQFRWDVFNALNLTRFDVQSLNLSITNNSNFGNYTGLLTNPRVMQFKLRYEF
jgi:hypothetical protein